MFPHRSIWFAVTLLSASACSPGAEANPLGVKVIAFPTGVVDPHLQGDITFSPDGRTLAVANYDGVVKLCDLTTGKAKDVPSPFPYEKNGLDLHNHVVYSRRGRFLAVSYEMRAIIVRDIPGMRERVRIPLESAGVHSMAFTEGDRTLLALLTTTAKDAPPADRPPRTIYDMYRLKYMAVRWDVSSGKRLSTRDFGKHCSFEVLSPDGRYAVFEVMSMPGMPFDRSYHVFDLASGAKLSKVGGWKVDPDWGFMAGSWVFSADSSILVWSNLKGVSIREVPSGNESKRIDTRDLGSPHGSSLSPDGRLLAVMSGRIVMLYNLKTGKLLDEVECHESASGKAVLISPDGRILATRSDSINGQDRWVQPLLKLWRIPDSW